MTSPSKIYVSPLCAITSHQFLILLFAVESHEQVIVSFDDFKKATLKNMLDYLQRHIHDSTMDCCEVQRSYDLLLWIGPPPAKRFLVKGRFLQMILKYGTLEKARRMCILFKRILTAFRCGQAHGL